MKCMRSAGGTVLLILFAMSTAHPDKSESRRAYEISDYYRTVFPGAPDISPDGKLIVFSARRYDLEKGETWSELWTMGSGGSDLRRITSDHNDTSPAFSPDGKRILFLSDRQQPSTQIYSIETDGGDPEQLTDFSMGVSAFRQSPDGRHMALTTRVFPECGSDNECNRKISKGLEGKLRVHVSDSLLYRHWDFWRDGAYSHIMLADAESGKILRDLTPGAWESPTFSLDAEIGYDFSPDGRELCFVSNHDADPASSTNADLWIAAIKENGKPPEAVNITAGNQGWDGSPAYSPDGRYIAYRSQATPGYESDLFRLAVYDREARTTRYLTDAASFDNWVTRFEWQPDSQSILFQAEYQARNPIYRISLADRRIQPVLADGTIASWRVSPDGSTVFYERRRIDAPPEIYRRELSQGQSAQLTKFNGELVSEVDLRPPEEMWIQGAGDYKVHTFVIKPHGFDPAKKYPLILNVHGGPQSQWMDSYRGDWQVYPGKGYVVAFANPTGSTGYGQAFTAAISKDWGGRVFNDLMLVTDALEKLPYVDKDRMGSMGWSYGGYMMMWFEGHTSRFKASAAMMGVYNLTSMHGATEELWFPEWDLGGTPWDSDLYRRWSPSEYVKSFRTPCMVITGKKDFRVPYTQSLEFFTALQKMRVPSKLIVFEDAGHWPNWHEMAFYYNAHLDWFHRWLGGGAAPYDPLKFARNLVFR